ncbi:MAG: hypothetical protein U1E76_22015 [Planctomycetota bacterium]
MGAVLFAFCVPTTAHQAHLRPKAAANALDNLPISFIENRGQVDERVRFYARRSGWTAFFTDDAFVLERTRREGKTAVRSKPEEPSTPPEAIAGASVFLTFEGASRNVVVDGIDPVPGRYHYFLGKDTSRWRTNVPGYSTLRYRGLYAGVDVMVREHEARLEYDLILGPGAELDQIVVRCEGSEALCVDERGALLIETPAGRLEQQRPHTYQIGPAGEHLPVDCSFRLLDESRFGFEVVDRRDDLALVVDPGLVFSTFLGGTGDDVATAVAVDPTGALLVTGDTESADFPTTPGAYDTSFNGTGGYFGDVFVTKVSADGTILLYSTFLGGLADDAATGIAIDATGAALVTGWTNSADFPATPGAYETTLGGGADAFLASVSADGSALQFATFLGGSGDEFTRGIALDAAGAALVTGLTDSADFPTSAGAYDTSWNGGQDAFVAKLSADGRTLAFGTLLGGTRDDWANAIAADATGAAFVTGTTYGAGFPTTPGAYDTIGNGNYEMFISKLSPDGTSLGYSTFTGPCCSSSHAITVDASGAAVVTGQTDASGFPTTPGAYDRSYNGADDAFVLKLSADGSSVLAGTYLGGAWSDCARGIAIDGTGAILVVGNTYSPGFPTSTGAYGTSFNGVGDGFAARLSADLTRLTYSTFLGGSGDEWATAVAGDAAGEMIVAGKTMSADFVTTPAAYDTSFNGVQDAFLAKVVPCSTAFWQNYGSGWPGTNGVPSLVSAGNPVQCAPITLTLGNSLGSSTLAALLIGVEAVDYPTNLDGHLLVRPSTVLILSLPGAGVALSGSTPCSCELVLYLQALEVDPGASKGISFTPGLELVIGD